MHEDIFGLPYSKFISVMLVELGMPSFNTAVLRNAVDSFSL